MLYRSHPPAAPLGNFVEQFWFHSDAPVHTRARILPRGTLELVVNLRDDEIRIFDPLQTDEPRRFTGAVVSGAYSRYLDLQVHESVLGIHFRPGGAASFLGVPAGELANSHVDLESLWGPAAGELRARLCEAATPEARFSLLEAALLERLHRSPERHPAVPAALGALETADEEVSVREIARDIGLCQRRLIQVFTSSVGLTPKRYQRVCRFQRARELVRHTASPDWADVALECGYFDQSHLIHDFRQFTGFSPGEFKRVQNEKLLPNHVAQIP
jgi:AraC-like DNA-binding protein